MNGSTDMGTLVSLLGRCYWPSVRMTNELLLDLELSAAQYVVLRELAHRRPSGLSGVELASAVGASVQSVGAHVCALEDRGLIRRPLSQDAGRVIRNTITADGSEASDEATARLTDLSHELAARLTHGGHENALPILMNLLAGMAGIVDALIKEGG